MDPTQPGQSGIVFVKRPAHRVSVVLLEQVRAGLPVLITARASTASGRKARRLAVLGVYTAAFRLAQHGIDVRHMLPPRDALVELVALHARRAVSETNKGRKFVVYSYEYLDRAAAGLVVLIQFGTGSTVDKHHQQLSIDRIAAAIRTWQPALVYRTETRAWGRADFEMGPVAFALEDVAAQRGTPVYVGQAGGPIVAWSEEQRPALFTEGHAGKLEAKATFTRTRDGYRGNTMQETEGPITGPFDYALPGLLPPPMGIIWERDEGGGRGKRKGFLDTPACRPAPEDVYLDETTRAYFAERDGRLVWARADHLELVRWFYEHYGKHGWDRRATATYLAAHGWEAAGRRRATHGEDGSPLLRAAAAGGSSDPSHIIRGILRHREFHLSGQLRLKVGDESEPIVLTVVTPDGLPIATQAQLDRIDEYEAQLPSLRPRGPVHVLAGTPVTIDGVPALLEPDHHRRPDGVTRLGYVRQPEAPPEATTGEETAGGPLGQESAEGDRSQERATRWQRFSPAPLLRYDIWLLAVLRALRATDRTVVLGPSLPEDLRDQLEDNVLVARRQLAAIQHDIDQIELRFKHVKPGGRAQELLEKEVNAGPARAALARAALAQAESRLASAEEERRRAAVPLDQLLTCLACLRDPRNGEYRPLLRRAIGEFIITSRSEPGPLGRVRRSLTFSFVLLVVDTATGASLRVQVHGDQQEPARSGSRNARGLNPAAYAARIIDEMRQGRPAPRAPSGPLGPIRPYLLAGLGRPARGSVPLLNVTDPRLLRLGMALAHPPAAPKVDLTDWAGTGPQDMPAVVGRPLGRAGIRRLARETGEDPAFLEHLQRLYTGQTSPCVRWHRTAAPKSALLLRDAAHRRVPLSQVPAHLRGAKTPSWLESNAAGVRVRPCTHCGSRRRRLALIPEIVGLVCLKCRRDEAGFHWPHNPYDLYLDHPG